MSHHTLCLQERFVQVNQRVLKQRISIMDTAHLGREGGGAIHPIYPSPWISPCKGELRWWGNKHIGRWPRMLLGTWVLLGVYSTGCGVGKWLSVATAPVWHWCTPQGCRSSSLQKMHRSHWSIHQLCGINFLKICDPTQHWPKFEKLFLHHLYFFLITFSECLTVDF